ncbi:hypothetical protein [Gemmatimonas sp.]|uniref:hypothetical protein n=1 Tax=Gemmatimonas sp. TaxID=1962908 RepID=UPI0039834AFB
MTAENQPRVRALEIKQNPAVNHGNVHHWRWLQRALADAVVDAVVDAVIVTTGRQAYRREAGLAVVPEALLGPSRNA